MRPRPNRRSSSSSFSRLLCALSLGLVALPLLLKPTGNPKPSRSLQEQTTTTLTQQNQENATITIAQATRNQSTFQLDQEWWSKPQPLLKDWPYIHARNDIHPWLEKLGFTKGVEVGVQRGLLAKRTLLSWRSCQEYKLIDLWGAEAGYLEPGPESNSDKHAHFQNAKRILKPWTDKGITEFFRMRSLDAAPRLKDGYFDYVYIDARHDYCAVQEDIEAYWPKVRPGGILAGHDYITAPEAMAVLGQASMQDWSRCEDGREEPRAVKGAVDDFAAKQGLDIVTTHEGFDTWLIQKPYEATIPTTTAS